MDFQIQMYYTDNHRDIYNQNLLWHNYTYSSI